MLTQVRAALIFHEQETMKNSQRPTEVRQYNKSELPRLRWTSELHQHFAAAIERLGGKYKATPKRILQMMNVKGLKISHIKSHLQMYRSEKGCDDDAVNIPKKHLRAQRAQYFKKHGALSICSSKSQRRAEKGLFIDCEYRRENINHEVFSGLSDGLLHTKKVDEHQDYSSIHGKRTIEEDYGDLNEICELSLSFTPSISMMIMQNDQEREQEERESWPLTDGQSRQSSSIDNSFVNIKDFQSLGTNHHQLNLDLTI